MKTTIGRIAVITAAIACAAAVFATSASADDASFLDSLAQMGHAQSPGSQQAAIDLGWSICRDLASNGGDKASTVITLRNGGWTMQESADWVVVAESELCPQYK